MVLLCLYLVVLLALIIIAPRPSAAGVKASLPLFADDFSELAVAAVVERNFESLDLYLVIFLMGHKAFHDMPQRPFLMINSSLLTARAKSSTSFGSHQINSWRHAASTWDPNRRVSLGDSKMNCRLRNNIEDLDSDNINIGNSSEYLSKAHWLPSYLTADPGYNRNIDILRCKLRGGTIIHRALLLNRKAFNRKVLSVELLREEDSSSLKLLMTFSVPWRTRRTGYGFDIMQKNSRWDAWGGSSSYYQSNKSLRSSVDISNTNILSSKSHSAGRHRKGIVYACLSTIRPLEPFRMDTGLPMLLENIEHNIRLGFNHIFVSLYLDGGAYSIHMQRYRIALDGYIRSGLVSIISMALHMPGFDDVSGFFGVQLVDDYARWINQLQCLYLSKGVADHIVPIHSSEFITLNSAPPPGMASPLSDIQDLLEWSSKNLEVKQSSGNKISPCYYVLQSLGVPDPEDRKDSFGPGDGAWTRDFFPEAKSSPVGPLPAWAIVLVPTRSAWIVAWHVVAACTSLTVNIDFNATTWAMTAGDHDTLAGMVPWDSVAVVYHYRGHFEPWQMSRKRHNSNLYLRQYADHVIASLDAKGFRLVDGMLYLLTQKKVVDRFFPATEPYSLQYPPPAIAQISIKERTGYSFKNASTELVWIALSTNKRRRPYDATLSRIKPQFELEYLRRTLVGKKGLLDAKTWKECIPSAGCKTAADLVDSIFK